MTSDLASVAVGTMLLFVSDFTYLEGDRAIHFKLRTRGVL